MAPWETKRWIEKGAEGSSAKRERIDASVRELDGCEESAVPICSVCEGRLRHSLPKCSMIRAFESKDWPDLIMQPQPVSLLNPSLSARFRRRTEKVMPDEAAGSCDRGIGWKFDLYVIHTLDSKSSRNGCGQPPSAGSFDNDGRLSLDTC